MLENFIYAKEKALFEEKLNNGEVLDEAIVFIEDTKEIWNHGTYFDGSKVDLSNVEKSIQDILDNIPTKISQLKNDVPYVIEDVVSNGLYIYDTDNRFTLPENWNTANNSKAVGVAIVTDDCRFVVAKEDVKSSSTYWGGLDTDISTLTNYTSDTDAATDFDGVNNTSKIIAAIGNINDGYRDGTAAGDCAAYTFPNGKPGYLGAAGEWQVARQYKEELNSALTLIGGTTMKKNAYWTSTRYSSHNAWYQWFDSLSYLHFTSTKKGSYVRAFLAIEVSKPLKERVSDLESLPKINAITDDSVCVNNLELPVYTASSERCIKSCKGIEYDNDKVLIDAYGINFIPEDTDSPDSKTWNIHSRGDGTKFLSDDGTYKETVSKETFDNTIGDINTILESIINGGFVNSIFPITLTLGNNGLTAVDLYNYVVQNHENGQYFFKKNEIVEYNSNVIPYFNRGVSIISYDMGGGIYLVINQSGMVMVDAGAGN